MNYAIKYSEQEVSSRIRSTVHRLKADGTINENSIFLVMLNGGAWFASHVFDTLQTPENEVYYLKGHSYAGTQRTELKWDYKPDVDFCGKEIIVLDDICDSGNTISAIYDFLLPTAKRITFLTLIRRSKKAVDKRVTLYSCIEDDSDDFFVGCGMDDNNKARLLPFIGIVE